MSSSAGNSFTNQHSTAGSGAHICKKKWELFKLKS